MKIAYFDLNFTFYHESYSIYNANRYGGASVFAKYLKEIPNYYIFADEKCFDTVDDIHETKERCVFITPKQRLELQKHVPLKEIVDFDFSDFDLIVHHHVSSPLNLQGLKAKQLIWNVGYQDYIHPRVENLLLYNQYQKPNIQNPKTNVFYFQLGTLIPITCPTNKKENYIFQCCRHCTEFCSVEVADFCRKNRIKAYFAGPIVGDYPILNSIDNKYTFYLGEISQDEKLYYTQHARLYCLLFNWHAPFNLSMIEALSHGTPVVTTNINFTASIIKHGYNGFFARDDSELLKAWDLAPKIEPINCYRSSLRYSHFNMLDSLFRVFERVLGG